MINFPNIKPGRAMSSEECKAYRKTDKYKAYQKAYQKTDKYKAYKKAYYLNVTKPRNLRVKKEAEK